VSDRSAGYRILRGLARGYVRVDRAVERARSGAGHVVGAVLGSALATDEQTALGIALWELRLARSGGMDRLYPWEVQWLDRRLPPPPSTILIGGAGRGREAAALAGRGYLIDAFEPAPSGAAACRTALDHGGRHRTLRGAYEELSAAVLDGADTALAPFAARPYDVVLLGWGSLSHVLERAERRRAFEAAHRLAPRGPILASFLVTDERRGPPSRGARLGATIGRGLSRLRSQEPPAEPPDFGPTTGFRVHLSRDEIESHAAALGRRCDWEPELGYPHVTLPAP
jgi:hypothetical protein